MTVSNMSKCLVALWKISGRKNFKKPVMYMFVCVHAHMHASRMPYCSHVIPHGISILIFLFTITQMLLTMCLYTSLLYIQTDLNPAIFNTTTSSLLTLLSHLHVSISLFN
ncbi:hypothetical protein CHS0354_002733 [Potamilus streckersoni]|uniref:Uncharacterized protein n=1 Tax=Potamilus streckersoni TaxID=2493646 RepID=A0AAE0VWZ9_9BIVA|nr:hypothetical protein CHS0354_002733 [Potamilus streckersoni]